MSRASILIVDDQESVRRSLTDWLGPSHDVSTVGSGEEGLRALEKEQFDILLLDQRLPRMSGLEVLRVVAGRYPDLHVIMMTGFGSVDQAVEAIKLGAADYLLKPVDLDTLQLRIDKILQYRALAEENRALRAQLADKFSFHSIITGDRVMKEICLRIQTVARTDAAVLIQGESGTGKELVARALHLASDRAARPFLPVACGAIPDTLLESELFGHEKGAFTGAVDRRIGKFEEAADGTVFLDEIGELSSMAQVKFLRILEERKFRRVGGSATLELRARLVSATNRGMDEAVETGEFRRDLFYRINTIRLDIPPLRDRAGDIPLLSLHFLQQFARSYQKTGLEGIDPEALRILQSYSWPGNVRELRGVMEQAVILARGEVLTPADLSEHVARSGSEAAPQTFHQQMHDFGRKMVLEALDQAGGLKREAAERLGLSQRAFSHYIKKYGLS